MQDLRSWLAGVVLLGAMTAARPAHAQVTLAPESPFPDPSKYARGVFVEAGAGARLLLGGDAGGKLGPGPAVELRAGYDVLRWLGAGIVVRTSSHRGRFAGQPQDGELVQLYDAGAELRLAKTFRQLGLFAYGGAGYGLLSTNLLEVSGLATSQGGLLAGGGAGLDWHTLTRHFSFGLGVDVANLAAVSGALWVGSHAYVRYTF